ncbi:class II glutamine amidotransferase [Pendulispora rubella]|uniref:Class II glutamine amidotransferase n=1 Tax=Pendulispora rubella TaxID=2741070 RepID=A0ABZ2LG65_9BACT
MARLFGLIGNRADLAARVLASEADALCVHARAPGLGASGGVAKSGGGGPLGWGMGFYQGGEVLIRRRPIDDRPEIDVAKNAHDVRADILIGHVRQATVGSLRTENTHPFRYRQWLFAQTGTVSGFEGIKERLAASVPEFLRGGIRGETDAEIVFHVFLSFLHDAGRLEDMSIEEGVVRDALRSTLSVVDGMTAEIGAEPGALNTLVTNGDVIVALHRNDAMAYRQFSGKADADALIGDDLQLRRRAPELAHMHFVLLASDLEDASNGVAGEGGAGSASSKANLARWKKIPDRAIVTLTRGDDPKIEVL